ncbi:protein-ADP-ribose hydrolase [Eubacterium sp.]
MTQEERLNYLLEKLKEDSTTYKNLQVEDSKSAKMDAVRSLMNIRMPGYIDRHFLKIQDEFLQEQISDKGIVTLDMIPTVREKYNGIDKEWADRISIWQGDITRLKVDAIVNAANSQMLGCFVPCHRCIDNAIHSAAGMQLREECDSIMKQRKLKYGMNYEEPTGTATITGGYNLPSKHVIHTVGPICYFGLTNELRNELRRCYKNVLKCCVENDLKTVALCCISTGEFRFPNDEAAKIAMDTTINFLKKDKNMERIIFCVYKDLDKEIYEQLVE